VWCEFVVLDEADRMLDMGFIDDVTTILDKVPAERQTMLFSATLPQEVRDLLHRYMKDPEVYSTSTGLTTVPDILQTYVEAEFPRKFKALQKILEEYRDDTMIIFCNTRRQAIDLDRMLWGHGYSAGALHGDHDQDVRFRVLESFRSGDIKILVATDVASRGLDVDDVACVINYEIPDDPGVYVHRIGRTGRAQKSGAAISIVAGKEWSSWSRILKDTGFQIERTGPERIRKRGGSAVERRTRPERGRTRAAREGGRRASPGDPGRRGRRSAGRARGENRAGRDPSGVRDDDNKEVVRSVTGNDDSDKGRGDVRATGSESSDRDPGRSEGKASDERQGGGTTRRRRRPRGRGRGRRQEAEAEAESNTERPDASEQREPSSTASVDRARQPKRDRVRLDDLDDDFVKTDYFSVDHAIIERAGPTRGPASGRSARSGSERRGPPRERADHRSSGGEETQSPGGSRAAGSEDSGSSSRRRRRRRPPRRGRQGSSAAGSTASDSSPRSSGSTSPGSDEPDSSSGS
jgi:ATP-dependent RNA helicase DeaD